MCKCVQGGTKELFLAKEPQVEFYEHPGGLLYCSWSLSKAYIRTISYILTKLHDFTLYYTAIKSSDMLQTFIVTMGLTRNNFSS